MLSVPARSCAEGEQWVRLPAVWSFLRAHGLFWQAGLVIRTDWIAASMAALGTILNWLGNHPHPDELWLMRALTPLGVRRAGPRLSSTGSERGPAFLGDEHDPWKIRMSNPAAANAIAEYNRA